MADPDLHRRPSIDDDAVGTLLASLGADGRASPDLGGTMSLNLHLREPGLVLRVHGRATSRNRIVRLRALRRQLADAGLLVGAPQPLRGAELLRVGPFVAEVETYVAHTKPAATRDSYVWMYHAMGELHRALREMSLHLPRPRVATYAVPSSLRRWLTTSAAAVDGHDEAASICAWAVELARQLDRAWIPPSALPRHLVHGDIRLGNVALAAGDVPAYFDFGFAAARPRIHELAYSLSWIIVRPDDSGRPESFDWDFVSELVAAYEDGAGAPLVDIERRALAPYLAAVPIYMAAIAAFTPDPVEKMCGEVAFLRIAEWALAIGTGI